MNVRIRIETSVSVALILLMCSPANAQSLRLKKTGPNSEPQRLIPPHARNLATTESQAYPVKPASGLRQPEFEMPLKVAVKPTVKRAHYEPRQQRPLRKVTPISNEPTKSAEPIDELAPPNELGFEPPTRETEFELPRVLPDNKRQPVETQVEVPPSQTTPPTEIELPSPQETPNQGRSVQPPASKQTSEEAAEAAEPQPTVPNSEGQTDEPSPAAQPAKEKSTVPHAASEYEEPAIIPMPRTAKDESLAPVHLPRLDEIDVRDATRLKPTNDGSSSIQAPANQAQLLLGMRPPVYYGASAWPGLQMNRNTYPFCHKPLYFENPNLERCGYHYGCLTTPVSMAFFYGTIPILPYRHGAEPPWECVPSLPDCRYGDRFGYDAYLPPLSLRGAVFQAAATVGMIYAVP